MNFFLKVEVTFENLNFNSYRQIYLNIKIPEGKFTNYKTHKPWEISNFSYIKITTLKFKFIKKFLFIKF